MRLLVNSDSSNHIRSRGVSSSRVRLSSLYDLALAGTCTREANGVWSSARWKVARTGGMIRPWMEHSWNDSGSTSRFVSSGGFTWGAPSRTLRGRLDWDWNTSKASALVSQDLEGNIQDYRLGLRLEAGQNLVTHAVRGQGTITCDW